MTDEIQPRETFTPTKRGRGRPLKLTREAMQTLVEHTKLGSPMQLAAAAAGISNMTFSNWMRVGREEQEAVEEGYEPDPDKAVFLELYQSVNQARVVAAERSVAGIQRAIQGGTVVEETVKKYRDADGNIVEEKTVKRQPPDWRAGAWYLERQHAQHFGKQTQQMVQITGADGGPVKIEADAAQLSKRLSAHLAERAGGAAIAAGVAGALNPASHRDDLAGEPADDDIMDAEVVDDDA